MGQIYSFLGYAGTSKDTNEVSSDTILGENFSCKICLEILHDPVQCQNNEHYFCRACITKHLGNSQTCPLCMDQLTLETLRPVPRIVARVVCQMKKRHSSSTARSHKAINGEGNAVVNGRQIFIFGGHTRQSDGSKSVEVFNWSTKTWTLMDNSLFFSSVKSFSFPYGKRLMICGGRDSKRIEFFDPSENGFTSTAFPGILPSTGLNGVLFENRVITFGNDIQETSLKRPWKSTVLVKDLNGYRGRCAIECIGKDIFVIGYLEENVERYDTANKQLTTLAYLPYKVSNVATVVYKDNIIILGGDSSCVFEYIQPKNDVVMFNIHSLECKRLPSMLEKRSGCAAVIIGDVIVVMGGRSNDAKGHMTYLKTVEYLVIGEDKWQELPAMNRGRECPTACVYT